MTCKERCRSNNDCKFYYFLKDGVCDLYSTCNVTRNTVNIGLTFKKKGEYNDKLSQSVYNQNIITFLFIISKVDYYSITFSRSTSSAGINLLLGAV